MKKVCIPIMLILGPNSRWKEMERYLLIRVPASIYLHCCTGHFRVCSQTCIGYSYVWSGSRKWTINLYDFIFFWRFLLLLLLATSWNWVVSLYNDNAFCIKYIYLIVWLVVKQINLWFLMHILLADISLSIFCTREACLLLANCLERGKKAGRRVGFFI